MFGRFRLEAHTNPQRSSYAARNANTHSENTHKHCAFKGEILTAVLKLRERGYSEAYLATMMRALLEISNHADLHDSDDVLMYIARKNVKDSFKANLVDFYRHYAEFYGIHLANVRYRRDHRIPRVPLEEKIDMLVAHASKKYALIYTIIKECGLRPVEVASLTLNDVDLEKGILSVTTAKHGSPRAFKLADKTIAIFNSYVKSKNFGLSDKLFPCAGVICNTYGRLRTSLAKKLDDVELHKMRLYDLRHYYATMLYHRTKDILLVKEKLGHKNINNTLIYTHLVSFDGENEFYSATAKTVDEAAKLIEQGFDYVTDVDGVKLFRKRK
jgi:integrase